MSISAMVDGEGKETFDYQSNTLNPEETMVNYEQGERVAKAIEALPEGYRRLTEMFFMEQCSHKEIVQELNIPLNTVKVQIMRAKALLKDLLS
jgi:RNA polymerase sigma-70 factor (ECF subfamily)